jgi:hypothetical protein
MTGIREQRRRVRDDPAAEFRGEDDERKARVQRLTVVENSPISPTCLTTFLDPVYPSF